MLLFGVFAILGVLRSDFFWRWAGGKAVTLAQKQFRGDLQVKDITGNLFQGLFFHDIVLVSPEEELFRAESLEIRLSLLSLLQLRPVIGRLALIKPRLSLRQNKDGRWNIANILTPTGTPPVPKEVKFSRILIIDGEVEVARGGQTWQVKNLDLEMAVNLDNLLAPGQTITVKKVMAAASAPFGRVILTSRFTYRQNVFDVPLFEVKTREQILLSLTGKVDLANGGEIKANGELALLGKEIQKLWAQWPPDWDVGAKVQMQGTGSQVRLTLGGKVRDVALNVAGIMSQTGETWQYDLSGNLKNLTPDLLALYDKALLKQVSQLTPLAVKFHLQGTEFAFPPAHLSWSLETGPWQYGSAKVEQLKLSLAGDRQNQEFQGSVRSNIGTVALNARGSLLAIKNGQLSLQVDSLKPGPLGLGAPQETLVSGKFNGTFSSPGRDALDRLKVSGNLEASGNIGPHPMKKVQGRFAWGKDKLEIAQATAHVGNLTAEFKGSLVGDTLDFSHQGKSGTGGNWPIPAQMGGQFSWEGTLKGSLDNPQVALQARGSRLSYKQFSVQTVTLNAQSNGLPPSEGQVAFQATEVKTPMGAFSRADLRGNGDDQLWTFDLKASGPEGAAVEMRGGAHLCNRTLSLERAYLRLNNMSAQNLGPVEVSLAPGIEIKPVTFRINEGRASIQASLTEREISGRLEMQNLAAEWFTPADFPLKGIITGQATLTGQARLPVIQGEVRLEAGRFRDIELQSSRTSFGYQDNRLTLSGSMKAKDGGPTLSWDGQVPLTLTLMPFNYALGQEGMRISLRGENVNLSLLPALTKEVEKAQGSLKLLAEIEGPVNKPQVSGQVSWGPGYLRLRQTGATYQLQPGEIRLQGNRLTIPQLTLQSKGTATLTGDITLAGFHPDEVRAEVRIDNFQAIDKSGSEALVNGAINLSGRWPDLAVQGNLLIPKATFRLSFLNLGTTTANKDIILVRRQASEKPETPKPQLIQESEVWRNLRVDLNVQAPKNVWVDDRAAKIEAAVDVNVRKRQGQDLAFVGRIQALQGRVFIVGQKFQVTKGIVDLPAHPGAEPVLDARIEYETGDVTLFADVSGPASNPKIVLRGEPGISENDWMSYLLYGKPVAALSREEQGAATAAGAFGGLATKMILQDFLGMAPPLTKGLTITYQHRNDPLYRDDPYQVVIQYRINRRFSVQSQVGGRNTGGDVLFNYDF